MNSLDNPFKKFDELFDGDEEIESENSDDCSIELKEYNEESEGLFQKPLIFVASKRIKEEQEYEECFFYEEEEISEQLNYIEEFEELFNEDIDIILEEKQTFVNNEMKTPNIKIPNFREKVMEHIKKITNSIKCIIEQKKIILSESEQILKEYISRAENNDFSIAKNANLEAIAASIIYSVSISSKDIPKITATQLAKLIKRTYASITNLYKKYFESFYPEVHSSFDEAQMWVLFEKISNSFNLQPELEFYEIAENLYEQAKRNNFDPNELDLRRPKYIAAALIILSTHLSEEHKYITPQNLMENFRKEKELKKYGIQHRVITKVTKEIIKHTQDLFSTLPPYLSIEDFEHNIIRILDVFIGNFKLRNPSLLKDFAINVFNNANLNGFPYNKLTQYLHGSFRPSNISATLIFYALKHINYPDSRFQDKKYGTVQFEREFFPNDSTMQLRIASLIPFIYKYLPEELKRQILYAPLSTSKNSHLFDEAEMWIFFEKISNSLNLKPKLKLYEIAKNLYEQAKRNNFDPNELDIKNPRHIAATLIIFSTHLSEEHKYINPYNLIKKIKESKELSKYGFSDHSLASASKELLKYVRSVITRLPDTALTSEDFIDELIIIRHNFKDKDYISYLFCDLILHLIKTSGFKKPSFFLSKLNIYSTKPSEFIRILEEKHKLLVSEKFIKKSFASIENFIQNYIPEHFQKTTIKLYHELREYINTRKSDIERDRDERIKKRKEKYSRFYKSTYIRIKNFIKCSGLSPYDGYDLWENKTFDPETEKIRIWGQFHHIDYIPTDESEKDLVFLPLKNPNDRGKGKAPYITHHLVSSLEAIIKRQDTSQDIRQKSLRQLSEIENIIEHNSQILLNFFFTKDVSLIKDLIVWSNKPWYAESVKALISRVTDNTFNWCIKINDYIPKFRSELIVSDEELRKIFQELSDSRLL